MDPETAAAVNDLHRLAGEVEGIYRGVRRYRRWWWRFSPLRCHRDGLRYMRDYETHWRRGVGP